MGSSRFRNTYRRLDERTKAHVAAIKERADELAALFEGDQDLGPVVDHRCKALSMTKLEEAVMWAVKGVTG